MAVVDAMKIVRQFQTMVRNIVLPPAATVAAPLVIRFSSTKLANMDNY